MADEDVSNEVLDRLRQLRATVLGGLDRAPDLDALRKLLRQMFDSVTYISRTPADARRRWSSG